MSDDQFLLNPQPIKLDPAKVPPALHPLIPYAEKWGIVDEALQTKLLHEAPLEEIEELCAVFYPLWDSVWEFAFPRKGSLGDEKPNHDIQAFYALHTAMSELYSILHEERPRRLLEIIGWPEAWPTEKLDPAILPIELHSLIPLAEKWIVDDEGVRWTVFQAATYEELTELVSTVNDVGQEVVRDLALKMVENNSSTDEPYTLFRILELVEHAEIVLREHRRSHDRETK